MATMFPDLSNSQLNDWRRSKIIQSDCEVTLYKAFKKKLPKTYTVFFQVGWILRKQDKKAKDGESDFLIYCPNYGYICIEAKGSAIRFDATIGKWESFNRDERKWIKIKDPVKQAENAKHSTLAKIKESPDWQRHSNLWIENGHAVFFPDIHDVRKVIRPNLPLELIGYAESLHNPEAWIESVTVYWNEKNKKPHDAVLKILQRTFARSFEVHPLLSKNIEQQKIQRLKLTNNQKLTLDILKNKRRVAISGGAGTGKTVLAVEKAKRLAQEGFKTLLTCYNRQLADHLSLTCKNIDNLEVMGFHQLCDSHIRKFNEANPDRDILQEAKKTYPGQDKWDVQMPAALASTADNLAFQFEAVVCDEGQDFREEYWLPIEFLLTNSKTSPLYVFFDGNQNVYERVQSFPIENQNTFPLTDNCRNTTQIHHLAYKFYKGEWIDPPNNPGAEIKQITPPSFQKQAKKIAMEITNLIANENVSPGDISVLILHPRGKKHKSDLLISEPLPSTANWLVERFQGEDDVLIDTVSRYKGLESEIVFLWGIDDIDLNPDSDLLYVGISRAKSVLYLVGSNESWANIHGM